jgi:hypothetical protein
MRRVRRTARPPPARPHKVNWFDFRRYDIDGEDQTNLILSLFSIRGALLFKGLKRSNLVSA